MAKIICTTVALEDSLIEDDMDDDILQHGQRESATNINLNQPLASHRKFIVLALYAFFTKKCTFNILIFYFIGEQGDQDSLNEDIFDKDCATASRKLNN